MVSQLLAAPLTAQVGVSSGSATTHSGVNSGDQPDAWAQFRGPEASGAAANPSGILYTGMSESWKIATGSGYCGLSIARGIVVTCAAEDDSDVVLALDAARGGKLWSLPLSDAFKGYGGSLDGAIATPTVVGETVYMLGRRGQMVAIELTTGRELWRQDLAEMGGEPGYYGYSSSPLVVDSRVLVQVGGKLGGVVALDRSDGAVAWRSFESGIDAQSPVLAGMGTDQQVVVSTNQWLAGLEPETGNVLWSWPYESQSAFVTSTSPLPLADGRIFFTPADDRAVLLQPPSMDLVVAGAGVASLSDAPEPRIVWQENLLTRTYSPAAVAGETLVGYTSRLLSAYDLETGERRWRSRAPGDGFLIAVGEQLVVITKSGSLHLADTSDPEGKPGYFERAALQLFEDIVWTPPSFADGAAFVRSMTEIARVDLLSQPSPEARGTERTRSEANLPVPSALLALLEGDDKDLESRIDRFLEGVETPLIETGEAGAKALFLYRDQDGAPASDVGIAGDFLGMRMEGAFTRLADSSLWWYEIEVDPRLQYTYLLYVDYEPQLDPRNSRRESNSVMGWNANWVRGPEPVEMSYFAMPEWPGPPPHLRPGSPAPGRRGRVARVSTEGVADEHREMLSDVRVWLPPGYDQDASRRYPTVYLHAWPGALDAEVSRLPQILDSTVGMSFEPLIFVFFQGRLPLDASLEPLVELIDRRYRTRQAPESRANYSMAWGGYETMIRSFREPELFRRFAVQSFLGFEEEVQQTLDSFKPLAEGEPPWVGYIDWGILDIRSPSEGWDMRKSAREVYETLRSKGVVMSGGAVVDTTDWKSWRLRAHRVLEALFPPLR